MRALSKVFIVISGSYSDYHLVGIYSTKEKAEYAKKLYASNNDIEEYVIDDFSDTLPKGLFLYEVNMYKNGNVHSTYLKDYRDVRYKWQCYIRAKNNGYVAFNVFAKNKKNALKIANEYRTGLIANNQWTTNFNEWYKIADQYKFKGYTNE